MSQLRNGDQGALKLWNLDRLGMVIFNQAGQGEEAWEDLTARSRQETNLLAENAGGAF